MLEYNKFHVAPSKLWVIVMRQWSLIWWNYSNNSPTIIKPFQNPAGKHKGLKECATSNGTARFLWNVALYIYIYVLLALSWAKCTFIEDFILKLLSTQNYCNKKDAKQYKSCVEYFSLFSPRTYEHDDLPFFFLLSMRKPLGVHVIYILIFVFGLIFPWSLTVLKDDIYKAWEVNLCKCSWQKTRSS